MNDFITINDDLRQMAINFRNNVTVFTENLSRRYHQAILTWMNIAIIKLSFAHFKTMSSRNVFFLRRRIYLSSTFDLAEVSHNIHNIYY